MRAALLPLLDQRPWTDVSTFRQVAPWWRDWLSHPSADDPFWAGISPAAHPQYVRVPALITTGWYDQFLPGGINAFTALRNRDAGEPMAQGTRMIIGFWSHGVPGEPIAGHLEGIDAKTGEAEATGHLLSFLETWVKGVPGQTSPAPIRLYVMGANEWRDEHEWPLARTNWRSFYLNSGGAANTLNGDGTLAAPQPGPGERPDVFEYDPANPVPQIGGRVITLMSLPGPGPFDQRRNEERPDVLVYTSEPLAQDMEVTGPVTVELWTSSSAVSTDSPPSCSTSFPTAGQSTSAKAPSAPAARADVMSRSSQARNTGSTSTWPPRATSSSLGIGSGSRSAQVFTPPTTRIRIPAGTSPTKISAPTWWPGTRYSTTARGRRFSYCP
jgi:uncharacterized protein